MEKMVQKAHLLLFDLDGLLVDTEPFHWEAYKSACETLGGRLPWDFQEYLILAGRSATAIQEALQNVQPGIFQKHTWEELYRIKKAQVQKLLEQESIPLMPGVKAFIELHRQKPKAIVTHSPKAFSDLILKTHPFLSQVPCWIYREKYTVPKPSPESYLLACREMNVDPTKALGFEDTLRGIDALVQAGCTPILVNSTNKEFQKICSERQILAIPSFLT